MFFASKADSTMAGAKDAPDVYISLSWPIGDAECIRRPLTAGDMKLLRSQTGRASSMRSSLFVFKDIEAMQGFPRCPECGFSAR